MRPLRLLLPSLAAALCLLAVEGQAQAGPLSVGIGPIGAFGGNFLDKPDDKTYPIPGTAIRAEPAPSYPGFGGSTGGFGLALDARLLGLVGLEIDVIRMTNKGSADIDLISPNGKTSHTIEIGHSAWHIPILLKGSIPLPLLSPFIVAGMELVRTSDATASISPSDGILTEFAARTSNYTMFTGGLGLELKLPIPLLDIRIPLTFRGSYYNPGDKLEDRAAYNLTVNGNTVATQKVTYDTRWKYQVLATLAAQIYF